AGRDLDLRLERGGSLSGLIKSSEGDSPVGGAQVRAICRTGAAPAFEEAATSTAEGRFSFDAVPASRPINLRVGATGFEARDDRGILVGKGQSVSRDLTLKVGLTVHGLVVDGDTHAPVSGAKVNYGMQSFGGKQEIATDTQGGFDIPGIARGSHLF